MSARWTKTMTGNLNVTITNDVHNTERTVIAQPACGLYYLTEGQARDCRAFLCGVAGCCCGGVLGQSGEQCVHVYGEPNGEVALSPKPQDEETDDGA